jgi:hypothetical protein
MIGLEAPEGGGVGGLEREVLGLLKDRNWEEALEVFLLLFFVFCFCVEVFGLLKVEAERKRWGILFSNNFFFENNGWRGKCRGFM